MSTVEIPNKQIRVDVDYAHVRGDSSVSAEESWIILIRRFWVNDHLVFDGVCVVSNDGPFLMLTLDPSKSHHPLLTDEENERNLENAKRQVAEIRDELTPQDWLEGTTDDILLLPVASINFREDR